MLLSKNVESKDLTAISSNMMNEVNYDVLINALHSEIAFLHNEMASKDAIIKSLINGELMLPRENGTSVQSIFQMPSPVEALITRNKEIDINETNNKKASTNELYDEVICVTNEENEANTNDEFYGCNETEAKSS